MGVSYVIPDVNRDQLMAEIINTDIHISDKGDCYLLELPADPEYALQKRVGMARFLNKAPDDLGHHNPKTSWVFVDKTDDTQNTWLTANSVSVSNPELVIERILQQLELAGIAAECYSEHTDEYWEIADDEITESDLPK